MLLEADKKRRLREEKIVTMLAWQTAYYTRMDHKKFPSLKKALRDLEPKKPMDEETLKSRMRMLAISMGGTIVNKEKENS